MPIKVEEEIKRSVRKAHPNYSEDRVTNETMRIMNKEHLLRRKKKSPTRSKRKIKPWSSQGKIRRNKK